MKTYNIADKLAQKEVLHVIGELLKSDGQHERYMLTRFSLNDENKPLMSNSVFDNFSRHKDKFLLGYKYPKTLEYLLNESLIRSINPVVAPSLGFEHNWTARIYRLLKRQVSPYDSRFHSYIIQPDFQRMKEYMDEKYSDKCFIDKVYPNIKLKPLAELEYLTMYLDGSIYENERLIHTFDTQQRPYELILSVLTAQNKVNERRVKIDGNMSIGLSDRLETINKAIIKSRYYLSQKNGFVGFMFK